MFSLAEEAFTDLMDEVRYGNDDVSKVRLLVEAGAEISDCTGGYTPLHVAAECSRLEAGKYLHKMAPQVLNQMTDQGFTPIELCGEDSEALMLYFIANGANIYSEGILHRASNAGYTRAVKRLIAGGVDANAQMPRTGITALHDAAMRGNAEMTKMLLDIGADVNMQESRFLQTPLHYATRKGFVGVVKCLLEHGADMTKEDVDGITSCNIAETDGSTAIRAEFDRRARIRNVSGMSFRSWLRRVR